MGLVSGTWVQVAALFLLTETSESYLTLDS